MDNYYRIRRRRMDCSGGAKSRRDNFEDPKSSRFSRKFQPKRDWKTGDKKRKQSRRNRRKQKAIKKPRSYKSKGVQKAQELIKKAQQGGKNFAKQKVQVLEGAIKAKRSSKKRSGEDHSDAAAISDIKRATNRVCFANQNASNSSMLDESGGERDSHLFFPNMQGGMEESAQGKRFRSAFNDRDPGPSFKHTAFSYDRNLLMPGCSFGGTVDMTACPAKAQCMPGAGGDFIGMEVNRISPAFQKPNVQRDLRYEKLNKSHKMSAAESMDVDMPDFLEAKTSPNNPAKRGILKTPAVCDLRQKLRASRSMNQRVEEDMEVEYYDVMAGAPNGGKTQTTAKSFLGGGLQYSATATSNAFLPSASRGFSICSSPASQRFPSAYGNFSIYPTQVYPADTSKNPNIFAAATSQRSLASVTSASQEEDMEIGE